MKVNDVGNLNSNLCYAAIGLQFIMINLISCL